jgi:predicted HAD superfamily Cof-like phosphohydrolase
MMYILCGTIIEHGLQHKIEEVFDEIQRSNMSKLGADGPIYREDGKVMKGPNYFKPDFSEDYWLETAAPIETLRCRNALLQRRFAIETPRL